jgi:small subunit ribosomal protein S20
VAHSLSAKKRIRQNIKHRARNRARKETIKTEVKSFLTALTSGDAAKLREGFNKVSRTLDRVASKGTIHKNAAARKRSRLARRMNAALATKGAGSTAKA